MNEAHTTITVSNPVGLFCPGTPSILVLNINYVAKYLGSVAHESKYLVVVSGID